MKCVECGSPMRTRKENYRYDECGLKHVTFVGVDVARCPRCGNYEISIPHIEELHRLLAKVLIEKSTRFTGEEIRFLRKGLGWCQRRRWKSPERRSGCPLIADDGRPSAWRRARARGGVQRTVSIARSPRWMNYAALTIHRSFRVASVTRVAVAFRRSISFSRSVG